jgi:hypothetical protein
MSCYSIETYVIGQGLWQEQEALCDVVEAVIEYESLRLNNPSTKYRLIQILKER